MSPNQSLIDAILNYAQDVDTLIRTVKASDATLFDGKTMSQLVAEYTQAIVDGVQAHAILSDNPHGVTKAQVGLSDVLNYGVATQAEAEAGILSDKYVTALRVKQAIGVIGGAAFLGITAQAVDSAKLEGKTLAEVTSQILAGTIANASKLENQTLAEIITAVNVDIDTKIAAAIASLVDTAPGTLDTLNELAAALGNDPNFATTVSTQIASKETPEGAQAKVDLHANRLDNPHAVTKAQVGLGSVQNLGLATQAQAQAGAVNTVYMTPLRTLEAIAALGGTYFLGKTDQSVDSAKLEGSTLAQVIATARAGNADTATKLQTARTISISGDGSATGSFDGSANLTLAFALANSGVTAGTYGKVTVNAKGIVTAGAALLATDIPNLDASKLTSGVLVAARLSGTYSIDISGNATSASQLETARTINGVSFNGTANITVPPAGSTWSSSSRISILNGSVAQGINIGSLLVSDNYSDVSNVPATGAYVKGNIVSAGTLTGTSVYANNWFRSSGNTGWYNETHGGGWYMTDTTWIRTYNGKALLVSGGTVRIEGNTPQVQLYDSDAGILRYLYADGGNIGFLTSGGAWAFQCDNSGNVVAAGNVSAYSDRRTKKAIRPIKGGIKKLRKLEGVTYVDKESGEERMGLIAQNVQQVMPQAVTKLKDKRGTLALAYGNLGGLYVEAIKDVDDEVQELKAANKVLQAEVKALKLMVEELIKNRA